MAIDMCNERTNSGVMNDRRQDKALLAAIFAEHNSTSNSVIHSIMSRNSNMNVDF